MKNMEFGDNKLNNESGDISMGEGEKAKLVPEDAASEGKESQTDEDPDKYVPPLIVHVFTKVDLIPNHKHLNLTQEKIKALTNKGFIDQTLYVGTNPKNPIGVEVVKQALLTNKNLTRRPPLLEKLELPLEKSKLGVKELYENQALLNLKGE